MENHADDCSRSPYSRCNWNADYVLGHTLGGLGVNRAAVVVRNQPGLTISRDT